MILKLKLYLEKISSSLNIVEKVSGLVGALRQALQVHILHRLKKISQLKRTTTQLSIPALH